MATSNHSDRRDSVIPAGWPRQRESPPADSRPTGPNSDPPDPHGSHGYDTLKDPSRQIRLCRILPDTGSRALALERETRYLDDVRHQFIALSYAWAGMKLEEDIVGMGRAGVMLRNGSVLLLWSCWLGLCAAELSNQVLCYCCSCS